MQPSSVGIRSENQMQIERQKFDTEKDRLAEQVYKVVFAWIKESSNFVTKNEVNNVPKGAYACSLGNENTTLYFHLYQDRMLSNIPTDLNDMVQSFEDDATVVAAYNFFINKLTSDFEKKPSLKNCGNTLKNIENIKELRNSKLFKVASLGMLESITDIPEKANMLDDNKLLWWK